ncbi:MAG: SUMF1/EgtB/PvdO family nonheme iron enzyme [Myxococcales bacterium]|nr:SUMF1/EgtB/PvdO family nonheme iron enzyme [Myxococcales bacterium]
MNSPPPPSRPWWVTALIASAASMVVLVVALLLPLGWATVILAVGAMVFVVVLLKNPALWRRRLAGACVGATITLASAPQLRAALDLGGFGYLIVNGGGSMIALVVLAGVGLVLAALETFAERGPAGPRPQSVGGSLVQGDRNRVETHHHGPTHQAENDVVAGDKHETHHHYAAPLPSPSPPRDVDLDRYLRALLQKVSTLEIKGIASVSAINRPIEALYTPLCSVPLQPASRDAVPREPQPVPREPRRVPLPELFRATPRLLLEGQPGAGKSTFIQLVACMLARDHVEPRSGAPWRTEHLGLDPTDPPPIPALIHLSTLLVRLRRGEDLPDDERWILDILAAETCPKDHVEDHRPDHEERRRRWDDLFKEGRALLLLDGLDEVADERLRKRVLSVVGAAARAWPGARIVVTSRPISTEAMVQLGFEKAVIAPFDNEEIARFVALWSDAVYDAKAPDRSQELARTFHRALGRQCKIQRLAESPVMLTCLCVIHWNCGTLPEGRARVYREVFRWMLASRHDLRGPLGYSIEFVEDALQRLALAMMRGKVTTIDLGDAAVAIEEGIARDFPADNGTRRIQRAREWLRQECEWSHLIQEIEGDQIKFWHLTFQEFAAAWAIAGGGSTWREIEPHLGDLQWRETLALLGGCVHELSRGHVDTLMVDLLTFGEYGTLAEAALAVDVLDHIQGPLHAYNYNLPKTLRDKQKALAGRVLEIFTVQGAEAVETRTRIAAAEAIGRLGDPRLADDVDNFIDVADSPVAMGRFPITVEEFGRFVAEGGYQNRGWWESDGWAELEKKGKTEPWNWESQQEHPSRPVVGVMWYEARAYCRWLGKRLGRDVRLPKMDEWERAGTHADGPFPWGSERGASGQRLADNEIAERLANFAAQDGKLTPVGCYPAGAGPKGHVDLAGNVSEWCLDGPEGAPEERYLKGGCARDNDRSALETARYDRYWRASYASVDWGFRVVVVREMKDQAGSRATTTTRKPSSVPPLPQLHPRR